MEVSSATVVSSTADPCTTVVHCAEVPLACATEVSSTTLSLGSSCTMEVSSATVVSCTADPSTTEVHCAEVPLACATEASSTTPSLGSSCASDSLSDLLWGDEMDFFLDPYCAALSRFSVGETIDEGAVIVGDAGNKALCFFNEEHLGRDAIGFARTLSSLAIRRFLRMIHDGEDGRLFKVLKRIPIPWVSSLADRWP